MRLTHDLRCMTIQALRGQHIHHKMTVQYIYRLGLASICILSCIWLHIDLSRPMVVLVSRLVVILRYVYNYTSRFIAS